MPERSERNGYNYDYGLHLNYDYGLHLKDCFLWALPTPGLRNKTGFFWQYSQCQWNKAGAAVLSLGAALAFFVYKYWVHLFVIFSLARYNIFSRDWSLGNTLWVLGELEKGTDIFPVILPIPDYIRVFSSPFVFESFQL